MWGALFFFTLIRGLRPMWQFCYLQFGGAHVFDWWWLTGLRHNKDVAAQRDRADQVEDGHRHSEFPRPADSKTCGHHFTFPLDIIFKNGDSRSDGVTQARRTVDSEIHLLTFGRCASPYCVQALKTRLQNSTGSLNQFLRWPNNSSSPWCSAGRTPGAAACWV